MPIVKIKSKPVKSLKRSGKKTTTKRKTPQKTQITNKIKMFLSKNKRALGAGAVGTAGVATLAGLALLYSKNKDKLKGTTTKSVYEYLPNNPLSNAVIDALEEAKKNDRLSKEALIKKMDAIARERKSQDIRRASLNELTKRKNSLFGF